MTGGVRTPAKAKLNSSALLLGNPQEQPYGNGGAGTGKAPKGQADALNDADQGGPLQSRLLGVVPPPGTDPGIDDQKTPAAREMPIR